MSIADNRSPAATLEALPMAPDTLGDILHAFAGARVASRTPYSTTQPVTRPAERARSHPARKAAPLNDLLSVVGHEMRGALTMIQVHAEMVERDPSYASKAIEAIKRQTRQMDTLVGDLLSASSLEDGRLVLQRRIVDLVPLARACTEQAQALTSIHSVLVVTPDNAVEGWWDPMRVEQVLNNLLSNAAKYSPGGGEIAVSLEERGDMVRLAVTDHGLGISAGALPHLFDRFYRVRTDETRRIAGTGLGLYIVRALVEAHGGHIQVESEPGRGSTFTVWLSRGVPTAERGEAPAGDGD